MSQASTETRSDDSAPVKPNLRERLLEAAFEVTYAKGFRSCGLNDILALVGATKGALYHHFGSKTELGYALVDEHISRFVRESWIEPLETDGDGIEAIKEAFLAGRERALAKGMRVEYGCPLSNLAHEMASVDDGFRERIDRVFAEWRAKLAALIEKEQLEGRVRTDISPTQTATFIISSFQGCMARTKITRDPETMEEGMAALFTYLDLIRADMPGVTQN